MTTQTPDIDSTGPSTDLSTSQQPAGTTRVEDGTAYGVDGKPLGSANETAATQPQASTQPWTPAGATPVYAAPQPAALPQPKEWTPAGATPVYANAPTAQQKQQPGFWDTGIAGGIKRNTYDMAAGLYHAFFDERYTAREGSTTTEDAEQNAKSGTVDPKDPNHVPEDLAINPSRATLAYHRLIDAPADQLNAKADDELAAARELWDNKHRWTGFNASMSAGADKFLANVPMVGPMVEGIANRMENGDIRGGLTDIAFLHAYGKAAEALDNHIGGRLAEVRPEGPAPAPTPLQETVGRVTERLNKPIVDARELGRTVGKAIGPAALPVYDTAYGVVDDATNVLHKVLDYPKVRTLKADAADAAASMDDLQKAFPRTKRANYSDEDLAVSKGWLDTHHINVGTVNSVEAVRDALDNGVDGFENVVSTKLEPFKNKPLTVVEDAANTPSVLDDVRKALKDSPRSDFVTKGLKELEVYNLDDPTLGEADAIRRQLNAENKAILQRNNYDIATAEAADPAFAARQAAAESLRTRLYDRANAEQVAAAQAIEDPEARAAAMRDVLDLRSVRQAEGSLIEFRKAVMNQIANGEKFVRGTATAGFLKKMLPGATKTAIRASSAGVGAHIAGPGGAFAGDVISAGPADQAAQAIAERVHATDLTRDALVKRAFEKVGKERVALDDRSPNNPNTAAARLARMGTKTNGLSAASETPAEGAVNPTNAEETKAAGKLSPLANGTEPRLATPANLLPETHSEDAFHIHEQGHAHVSAKNGIGGSVVSHSHPLVANRFSGGFLANDEPLMDQEGAASNYSPEELWDNTKKWLESYMGGPAADEVINHIRLADNKIAASADFENGLNLLAKHGITGDEAANRLAEAFDAAKKHFTSDATAVIENNVGAREPGLPETHHTSVARQKRIAQQIEEMENAKAETVRVQKANTERVGENAARDRSSSEENQRKINPLASTTVSTTQIPPHNTVARPGSNLSTDVLPGRGGIGNQVTVRQGDNVLGSLEIAPTSGEANGKDFVVQNVEVNQAARNQGNGVALYERAIQHLQDQGAKTLSSGSSLSPDAERVWKSLAKNPKYADAITVNDVEAGKGSKYSLDLSKVGGEEHDLTNELNQHVAEAKAKEPAPSNPAVARGLEGTAQKAGPRTLQVLKDVRTSGSPLLRQTVGDLLRNVEYRPQDILNINIEGQGPAVKAAVQKVQAAYLADYYKDHPEVAQALSAALKAEQ